MLIPDYLDGVAARINTIAGLTVTTNPMQTVTPPMAIVTDGTINYHQTFDRGNDELEVLVTVYVSRTDPGQGIRRAREYKSGHGARSVIAAIETSLGGADTIPNKSLRATTAVTREDTEESGAGHIEMVFRAEGLIPGKES